MFDWFSGSDGAVQLVSILVGLAVLLLGRRLFWLFVAAAGFLLGLTVAIQLLPDERMGWLVLVIAVLVGLIGALLAVFLQRVAVTIAGFLLGGYGLIWVLDLFMGDVDLWLWLAIFIVGGIVGASLILILFDAALILLSSIAGAIMIVRAVPMEPLIQLIVFVVLLIIGIAVQASLMRRTTSAPAA